MKKEIKALQADYQDAGSNKQDITAQINVLKKQIEKLISRGVGIGCKMSYSL